MSDQQVTFDTKPFDLGDGTQGEWFVVPEAGYYVIGGGKAVKLTDDEVRAMGFEPPGQLAAEPAHDLPVSPTVEQAVDLARRGVITHLTVHGERVAAIVPESMLDALRAAEDAEDAAEADVAMDEPGESIPWGQVKAELDL